MYGCLSIILFGFLIFIVSVLIRVAHFLFNMKKTVRNFQENLNGRTSNDKGRRNENEGFTSTERAGADHHHRVGEKFFEKDEGEYIEFEEISLK